MGTNARTDEPRRSHASRQRVSRRLALMLTLTMAATLSLADAQANERNGKEVVDTVCSKCHLTGVDGAPRIGDVAAWHNRASQGLSGLTQHALDGIRKMPAHGGRTDLSDLEISRAITYMVNQSGGNWIEPVSAASLAKERSGEEIVQSQCAKCHRDGIGGAPKIGDLAAWVPRMKQGMGYLLRSAIRGHGGMPPRGGQANLTDTELRSAILYMYNPAGVPTAPESVASSTEAGGIGNDNHRTTDGIDIYLGIIPANKLLTLPKDAPERRMHGGVPKGPGYYHINVSLYDEKARLPINDAKVEMDYAQPGFNLAETELEPMPIAGSYGNYIRPQLKTPYVITLHIARPGSTETVEAKFRKEFE